MRRSIFLVLVPAALILPIALFGLFAYQENVATTQTVAVSQGAIMLAGKDVVKETTTTTENPAIEEKQTTTTTTTEKPAIEEKQTTTTTEKPAIEEKRTTTKTKTETKY